MNPPLRVHPSARWPFWMLLAAWACANAPAVAVCAGLTWLGEARHFSHQQRLVTDVAFVLTGHEAPGLGVMASLREVDLPQAPPVAVAGVELKKLDLSIERLVEVRRPAEAEDEFDMNPLAWPDARRDAPPHDPPRVTAIG